MPDFWSDNEKAQDILKQIASLKKEQERFLSLFNQLQDLSSLAELEEEDDQAFQKELQASLAKLKREIEDFELQTLLSSEDDSKNAILTIHSGAGGTEACDWAAMLLRMYLRWIESKGYAYQMMDLQPGEEAGVKSAVVEVKGEYAYGYLKAESGVHRLVRISPFDANKRRHTSFASLFVYPEIEDNLEVDIRDEDLRIDTYRASGAGGQHVNKVSSAVRITHVPTGTVVQCQNERSQHKNREMAMKILRAKLYQMKKEEEEKKLEKIESQKKKIEWGSQIRSYVFHPYSLVKDHRTGVETSNTQAVIDGDLDQFINAFLTFKDNS
ncbi:MAG: peptide chain release factor 2 [candidate division Zixibacteria bacterium RBG_16_50_21]|nr:MAG: peptide chain release factor 2 [candidate division Zixibacteria bacterium RBG_16_50_21]